MTFEEIQNLKPQDTIYKVDIDSLIVREYTYLGSTEQLGKPSTTVNYHLVSQRSVDTPTPLQDNELSSFEVSEIAAHKTVISVGSSRLKRIKARIAQSRAIVHDLEHSQEN